MENLSVTINSEDIPRIKAAADKLRSQPIRSILDRLIDLNEADLGFQHGKIMDVLSDGYDKPLTMAIKLIFKNEERNIVILSDITTNLTTKLSVGKAIAKIARDDGQLTLFGGDE